MNFCDVKFAGKSPFSITNISNKKKTLNLLIIQYIYVDFNYNVGE